jgi:hypothetical protein
MMIPKFLASALFCLFCSNLANAASVSLVTDQTDIKVGDLVEVNLLMDFSDNPTSGGGVDVFFDSSKLNFIQFNFDPSFPLDPSFSHTPDLLMNQLDALAFGSFNGISGPAKVGTMSFETLAVGRFDVTLAITDNIFWSGGFNNAINLLPIDVNFQATQINVAPVPLPAGVWLLLSGFLLLTRRTIHRS